MREIVRLLLVLSLFALGSTGLHADQADAQRSGPHGADCRAAGHHGIHRHRQHAARFSDGCQQNRAVELTVVLEGTGSGRVSSNRPGIDCQTDCDQTYRTNARIRLSAQPYSGSVFTGWSGACSGTGVCRVRLTADTAVSANFTRIETPPLSLVAPYADASEMREINDYFNALYDDQPWGRIHDGLDIDPANNRAAYQSVCAGRVRKIYVFDNQVTLIIDCDETYSVDYNFETQAPATGQRQLRYILVTEGQRVAQGQVLGYLFSAANPERAHVHFTLYENAVPVCPAAYFTPAAHDSILQLLAVVHTDGVICRSGDVLPPPLITPYVDEADMARITAGYSSAYSFSPWGYPHGGLDIYPQGDLKPLQAACTGLIDRLELRRDGKHGTWQVEVSVVCDEYVDDPEDGGYFIPLTTRYFLRTMSRDPLAGQVQLDNTMVGLGDPVVQGTVIAYLKQANPRSHLHFELQQFGQAEFEAFGVTGIPRCPQAQFSPAARDSVSSLLQTAWPGAEMCYQ